MARANQRNDEYGDDRFANRTRLNMEIVWDTRVACSPDYTIIFHLSLLDLVEGGSAWEEVIVSCALAPRRCCLLRASSRNESAAIATSMP